jgi:Fur family peroxide stress response transcriptional regulator
MFPFVTAKSSFLRGAPLRARRARAEITELEAYPRAQRMLDDLKHAGLKMTPQRIAIVRLFAVDESHPTAQALFERLRSEFPSMSFATVYNTLDALATAGLSATIRLGNAARFDPNTTPHHHAVCDECGAVRDLPARSIASSSAARRRIARAAAGFQVRSVERIYRGLCSSCATSTEMGPSAVGRSLRRSTR